MWIWKRKAKAKTRKSAVPETGFIAVDGARVDFSVVRSKKRKRTIAFRMENDATLRVLAPTSTSLGYLTRFLQSRADWVAKRLRERRSDAVPDFKNGSSFTYLGYVCRLNVTQGGGKNLCRLSPYNLHVHVADGGLSAEALASEVRLEILLWLKKRARVKFKKRLDLWTGRMGVSYRKFILADAARRWGSCSADNVIRLNWRLMMAPLDVLDYVVAHELAHVAHKDHSPHFWNFVARFMSDCQKRRAALRRIERSLTF